MRAVLPIQHLIRIAIVCGLLLGFCASARALPPVTERFSYTIENEVVWSGPDFDIIANGTGTVRQTIFFDNEGNPVRVIFQGRYFGSLSNSVTGETVLDAPSMANIFVDLIEEEESHVGLFFGIEVPGLGTVARDAGRVVGGPEGITAIYGPHEVLLRGLEVLADVLQ
jgi:hypothetical protein